MKRAGLVVGVIAIVSLAGCSAAQTAISKRNLDVQTKMSATVFLDPVADDQKTIFVQMKNTSDKPTFTVDQSIKSALQAKGYTISTDPEKAHYILQGNILSVGKVDPSVAQRALMGGFGGATDGLLLGSAAAYAGGSNNGRGIASAGLLGAVGGMVADAVVKDVYFSVVTDLQIKEKAKGVVQTNAQHNLANGTSGSTQTTYSEESNFKAYQTRILSSANKVNLDFEEAEPELKKGLANTISGVF